MTPEQAAHAAADRELALKSRIPNGPISYGTLRDLAVRMFLAGARRQDAEIQRVFNQICDRRELTSNDPARAAYTFVLEKLADLLLTDDAPTTKTTIKLCTCAVITGGHRVPQVGCPVHGEPDASVSWGDTREKAE